RQWKQERKADALLRSVAEKMDLPHEEVYKKAGALVEEYYGLYEGFEKVAKDGPAILTSIGVPENFAKAFAEVAEERIRVKMVKVKGMLEIRGTTPNGVKIIQDAFLKAKKTEKPKDADVRFYVIAAPKYSVDVSAENYKRAEEVLQKVSQSVVSNIVKAGGQGTFRREK
ncbi:MAG: translation initiation factor IF-2 subunit alpha, partial [Candidatus Bathyarchaeia archaeon]